MARKNVLESAIEGYLEDQCRLRDVFVMKNTGRNGIPDRLLIYHGIHWFVEVKRPGEKPSELQSAVARKLIRHGSIAICVDTKPGVDELLEALTSHRDAPRSMVRLMTGTTQTTR